VTDPEDGEIDCSRVILQTYLGHDEHAHPLQSYTGCSGTVQTSLGAGHGAEANVFAVFEATYTDGGGTGGANPLTGRAIEQLQPKRKQAEYFADTGRAADGVGGGDPGVQRETTSDTAGGFQNIGFIEDGDWWSFDPTNLTGIEQLRFRVASATTGGRIEVRAGSVSAPVLATATVPGTGGWQTYTDVTVDLPQASTASGPLFLVARNPDGSTGNGSLFNVNWVDFLGRGVAHNSRPSVLVSATPQNGTAPVAVQFSGTATDPDGDTPLTYAWDFGDGATAGTANATHTYTAPGTFTATLTVTDSRGASGYASVAVTVTAPNTSCFGTRSDDFAGTALDRARWSTVVRESQTHAVRDGTLVLPTAVGDLYGTRNDATNIVLQPAPAGPWQATTKVSLAAAVNYQQAGLIVYGDDDNYAKLDLLFGGSLRVEFIRETAGTPRNDAADSTAGPTGGTIWLRLSSDGTNLTAAFSADGQTFTPVGRPAALAGITDPKVGLFALQGGTDAPVIDATFDWFQISPDEPAGPVDPSDEFTGSTLDKCRWNAITREDPAAYRIAGDALQIDVPNGDIYGTNNTGPTNFILQNAPSGDWTIQTRVDGTAFTEQYQQAGLLVYGDDDNYLKFDFIVDNTAGQPVVRRIEYRSEIGGTVQSPQPQIADLTSAVWHLRLVKTGTTYTASYSANGTDWTPFEPLTNAAVGATPKVGLFSLGGAQQASKPVSFDYFRLTTPGSADDVAPVTTAEVTGPVANGWYTGPATVTLTATDNAGGSGVARIEYQLDAETVWTPYTEPVLVAGDGVHEVRFRSVDGAGNVETAKAAAVQVDTTAPVTTATFAPPNDDGWHAGTVPVTLTAADPASGVAVVEYSLDGGAFTPYTQPVDVTGDGEHVLLYRATDVAGNVETVKSAVLTIDATKPTLLIGGIADGQLYGDSQDVRITFQAVDPTSGIRSVVGTLDGRAYQNNTLQAMYELNLGLHELVVTATDGAGNQTTSNVRFFVTTSFRDMQNLHDRFKATGRLSAQAHRQLSNKLTAVRQAEANGNDARALRLLAEYKVLAANSALVPEAEVRATLVRDADAMIVRLGGQPGAAGRAANDGRPLTGTGRLPGDATTVPRGGTL
jgi:PKD repeat protein